MTLLIKITDAEGNTLRQIDATPGQIISFQPGEQRIVLPYVDPSATTIKTVGDKIMVSAGGQEPVAFQGFALYLEDGTAGFTFGVEEGGRASSEAGRSQQEEPAEPVTTGSGNGGGDGISTVDYSEAALKSGMFLTSEEAADDGDINKVDYIEGTEIGETLTGTDGIDLIRGLGGDDTISGNESTDSIYGGPGADRINGNDGADLVDGGIGDDDVNGDAGRDTVRGAEGNDRLTGGLDGDFFQLSSGNDEIMDFSPEEGDVLQLRYNADIFAGENPTLKTLGQDIILDFSFIIDDEDNDDPLLHGIMTLKNVYTGGQEFNEQPYNNLRDLDDALKNLLGYDEHCDNLIIM